MHQHFFDFYLTFIFIFCILFFPQGFVIELLLTLESGIDTLADTVKNYDLLTAIAQYVLLVPIFFFLFFFFSFTH